jgi:dolichyl-phosphate-mannose--protein O-mannosyl transferase
MKKINASIRYARKERKLEEELSLKWRRLAITIVVYGLVMLLLWFYLKYLAES